MGEFRIAARKRRKRGVKRGKAAPAWKAALPAARAVAVRLPGRPAKRPSAWKLLGLAGIAGVAATGVIVARNRRAHDDLEPDELRERLHRRLAEAGAAAEEQPPTAPG